jgi:hypothetical protein
LESGLSESVALLAESVAEDIDPATEDDDPNCDAVDEDSPPVAVSVEPLSPGGAGFFLGKGNGIGSHFLLQGVFLEYHTRGEQSTARHKKGMAKYSLEVWTDRSGESVKLAIVEGPIPRVGESFSLMGSKVSGEEFGTELFMVAFVIWHVDLNHDAASKRKTYEADCSVVLNPEAPKSVIYCDCSEEHRKQIYDQDEKNDCGSCGYPLTRKQLKARSEYES